MKSIQTNMKKLKIDENELELAYYITVDEVNNEDYADVLELYGICVETPLEKACVSEITCDREKIEELERILSENLVTPVTLTDVVYDIMADDFF